MRILRLPTFILAGIFAFTTFAEAAPKKLLVVSITTGFRHSSIETGEKVLAELATKSGAFTVDFVQQPEPAPKNPNKPKREAKDTDETFKAKEEAYAAAMAEFLPLRKAWEDKITAYAHGKLATENIQQYDGFVFCNTTGELPFPDPQAFIDLIKGGKAFIAMHSGSDTFHKFRPYVDMLGGEFQTHKAQVEVEPIIHDKAHPATQPFPGGYKVFDEIYIFKSYDPATVHGLLGLNAHPNDGTPGYYPISWNKEFGKGKVFYTSLGHREDVWDPTWKAGTNERKNAPEIAQVYQDHILGGILWALGLKEGDATLGNVK
ncbi:ThuA domain-containing protein [Phragmitibacter flavus]|uniref:ThuA domain-containing protein n=1 Tax=Phragmitibacter flavus TaxID=2576071 RepID=A0A5R8KC80_9BACT|nr:ThuA domain-containing protein [Phragmitibacter flavus]TLD69910.1 ThuA domain-containing protein [Phragmitibacter flavus]